MDALASFASAEAGDTDSATMMTASYLATQEEVEGYIGALTSLGGYLLRFASINAGIPVDRILGFIGTQVREQA